MSLSCYLALHLQHNSSPIPTPTLSPILLMYVNTASPMPVTIEHYAHIPHIDHKNEAIKSNTAKSETKSWTGP